MSHRKALLSDHPANREGVIFRNKTQPLISTKRGWSLEWSPSKTREVTALLLSGTQFKYAVG